jgi:tetratricopeptide (TPR) repeat protein
VIRAGYRRRPAAVALLIVLTAGVLRTAASGLPDDLDARLAALRRAEESAKSRSPRALAVELAQIGLGYLEAGRLGPAIEVLEEVVARSPEDAGSLARLILALTRREDFEFARSYLDMAAGREPGAGDSGVYAEIGSRLASVHRVDDAVIAWELYRRGGGSDRSVLARLDRARREISATSGQRSLASDRFTIFGDETVPMEDLARIEDALSREYDRQAELFGAPLGGPQVVVVHAGRRYFSLISIPDWVSGVFDGKIRVSLDATRPFAPQAESVLSHELAHAFIRQVSGGRAPGWLHEGLAQWCSGRRIPRAEFRRELGPARPRSLPEMDGNLTADFDPQRARANYAEALGLVEYLVEQRGEGSVFCLVRDLGAGADVADVLRREAQMTPAELVAGWKAWAGI